MSVNIKFGMQIDGEYTDKLCMNIICKLAKY